MNIATFVERFYLRHSWIENIGYILFNDQFVMTVNISNYAQDNFSDLVDVDHIVGNFIFRGVKELEISHKCFSFGGLEILDVLYVQINGNLDKITFTIELGKQEDILLISFKAKMAEWVPFNPYI